MKFYSLLLLLLFPFLSGTAQDSICGFNSHLVNTTYPVHTDFDSKEIKALDWQWRSTPIIPVVFHVLWNDPEDNISTEKILAEIDLLNQVFTNTHPDINDVPDEFRPFIGNPNLNFCLAAVDPDGQPTSGIQRVKINYHRTRDLDSIYFSDLGGSSAWDTKHYLNIWTMADFGYSGYSSFPEESDTSRDGIIIGTRYVVSLNEKQPSGNVKLLIHEIGHYLGLHHLWGDVPINPQCIYDDGIADTPIQSSPSGNCPYEGDPFRFSCGHNNMFVNFMDYTPAECSLMFTQLQVERMHQVLTTYRPLLSATPTHCSTYNQEEEDFSFTIFPNPAKNVIYIHFHTDKALYGKLEVFDLNGRVVHDRTDLLYDNLSVVLPDLPQGFYIMKIGDHIQKFVLI